MISVLILTLNEEINLPDCLESVSWSDDIVVFDSFSDDHTVEIAKAAGASVVQRKFDNWSNHQNWGIQHIEFKHPWVFYIDADERCDDELRDELLQIVPSEDDFSAFKVRRKDHFLGQWMKHAQLYPTWLTRVFRPERIRYERLVNPVTAVDGRTGTLNGHLFHYPFSHGIEHWYARHNQYSSMEAQELIDEVKLVIDWLGLIANDSTRRRKALKQLAYRLPLRPWLVFFYLYFIRMGFLDGYPGFIYASLRKMYETMIDLKVKELRRRAKNLPI
jgi:glycosyltransferase involved in cell wall biosynthesis